MDGEINQTREYQTILASLKDQEDGEQTVKNLEIKFVNIEDFRIGLFDDILDLRSKEEFNHDNIVSSRNIPAVTDEQITEVTKDNEDMRRVSVLANTWYQPQSTKHCTLWGHSTHPSLALSSQLAEVLRGRGGEDGGRYRPLLVCQDGGLVSETAAAVLALARCNHPGVTLQV